jgi:hypothetical protein
MFDQVARAELEEMLGYERFVLRECGNAIRGHTGQVGPAAIAFHADGRQSVTISVADTLGDTGAGMVKNMSPLVLTSSHKLLDMMFEWTILQNDVDCPFKFEDKLKIINRPSSLIYPDFLGTDPLLRGTVKALYKELTPYRNAITHNIWGQATNGDLNFDFDRGGRHFAMSVPFDTVLALADTAELIGTMLVGRSADQYKLDTLRWLLDKLTGFHGQPPFGVSRPRFCMVTQEIGPPASDSPTIDLAKIRSVLARTWPGGPVTFDLTVLANTVPHQTVWKIPATSVPEGEALILDKQWDQFRVR